MMTSWYRSSSISGAPGVETSLDTARRSACATSSSEDLLHFAEAGDQRVDSLFGVVESDRGARGGGYAEPLQHRLRAVMPGAHGDALAVEDGAHIVRVHAFQHE